jgi:hypothetical protein
MEGAMGSIHKLIDEHGKRLAVGHVSGRRPARIVHAAAETMLDVEAGEVASFIYSGWCHAGLPHRKPSDNAIWRIKTDHITMTVDPGHYEGSDGKEVWVGCPFGPVSRLILIYLQTRALETGDRTVELGKNLNAFLHRLGLSQGGKTNRIVRDQIQRISHCRLTFHLSRDGVRGVANQAIVDTAVFFGEERDPRQLGLFVDTIRLSEGFYQQLRRHPVVLDETAIRRIRNNSRALDVYSWLAFRLHHLTTDTPITWTALKPQFGFGISRDRNFRALFADDLRLALSVYPQANVELTEKGIMLKPSPPPVTDRRPQLVRR